MRPCEPNAIRNKFYTIQTYSIKSLKIKINKISEFMFKINNNYSEVNASLFIFLKI